MRDIRITAEEWSSGVRHCGNCDGYGFYGVWNGTDYDRTECIDCNHTGRTASRAAMGEVVEPVAFIANDEEGYVFMKCRTPAQLARLHALHPDTPLYAKPLLAPSRAGLGGEWSPIESAPKDGRTIHVARHADEFGWVMGTAHWVQSSIAEGWIARGTGAFGELGLAHPTHWMHLPPPPAAADRGV